MRTTVALLEKISLFCCSEHCPVVTINRLRSMYVRTPHVQGQLIARRETHGIHRFHSWSNLSWQSVCISANINPPITVTFARKLCKNTFVLRLPLNKSIFFYNSSPLTLWSPFKSDINWDNENAFLGCSIFRFAGTLHEMIQVIVSNYLFDSGLVNSIMTVKAVGKTTMNHLFQLNVKKCGFRA